MRYLMSLLVDLVVLNLVAEFWHRVTINSFSVSLTAALLLQILMQLTLTLEHRVGRWFSARRGAAWTFLRFFTAWLILFASKFVMLGVIDRVLGDRLHFDGPMHGVAAFLVVVMGMLLAEEAVVRVHRRLQ